MDLTEVLLGALRIDEKVVEQDDIDGDDLRFAFNNRESPQRAILDPYAPRFHNALLHIHPRVSS